MCHGEVHAPQHVQQNCDLMCPVHCMYPVLQGWANVPVLRAQVAQHAAGATSVGLVTGRSASNTGSGASGQRRLLQAGSTAPGLFVRVFDGNFQPISATMQASVLHSRVLNASFSSVSLART